MTIGAPNKVDGLEALASGSGAALSAAEPTVTMVREALSTRLAVPLADAESSARLGHVASAQLALATRGAPDRTGGVSARDSGLEQELARAERNLDARQRHVLRQAVVALTERGLTDDEITKLLVTAQGLLAESPAVGLRVLAELAQASWRSASVLATEATTRAVELAPSVLDAELLLRVGGLAFEVLHESAGVERAVGLAAQLAPALVTVPAHELAQVLGAIDARAHAQRRPSDEAWAELVGLVRAQPQLIVLSPHDEAELRRRASDLVERAGQLAHDPRERGLLLGSVKGALLAGASESQLLELLQRARRVAGEAGFAPVVAALGAAAGARLTVTERIGGAHRVLDRLSALYDELERSPHRAGQATLAPSWSRVQLALAVGPHLLGASDALYAALMSLVVRQAAQWRGTAAREVDGRLRRAWRALGHVQSATASDWEAALLAAPPARFT